MLLADWVLGEAGQWSLLFASLLYVCYFAPLFALMAHLAHVQGSVLALGLLEIALWRVLQRHF